MFKFSATCAAGILVAAFAGAPGASAATITSGSLLQRGITLDLDGVTPCGSSGGAISTNVGTFTGSGPAGSGTASCGDRTTPQVKTSTTPHPYGRFDPDGGAWLDSNDLRRMTWNVDVSQAVRGVSFALTDAHDQPDSFFRIDVDDAAWEIAEREANGTLHLITILFDDPVSSAAITFRTRHNDGYGISEATVQPVPLPPALLLVMSGVGLMAAARRWGRSKAA